MHPYTGFRAIFITKTKTKTRIIALRSVGTTMRIERDDASKRWRH